MTNKLSTKSASLVKMDELREHPKNYKEHPDDQLEHIMQSIKEHGVYKNIVATEDGTILAGHGVYKAAKKMGLEELPVMKVDLSPDEPRALKLLAGDNEVSHLGEMDDRALSEILKTINDEDVDGLLGTGYDGMMLANLVMVTRPASEIQDFDHAAEWVGMPEYESVRDPYRITVSFETLEDMAEFGTKMGYKPNSEGRVSKSIWYPPKEKDDIKSVRFESEE